jgi:hypothetical protein
MDGMTLYHKIKEIDNNVIICYTTADINYIEDLRKGIIDIDKIVLYKPVLSKRPKKIRLNGYYLAKKTYLKSLGYSTISFVNPVEALNYFIKNFTNCIFGYNGLCDASNVRIRFNKKR